MGDIVIVGGGFSGLETARFLSRHRSKLGARRILLIDKKKTFDFLPVLPDVIGGRIKKEHAVLDLFDHCGKLRVNFENAQVTKIDTSLCNIFLDNKNILSYEFLVLACGSETDFYGLRAIEERALKLDTAQDAALIQNTVLAHPSKNIIVVGGGYTGVEVVTNLANLLIRKGVIKYSITLIEKEDDILKRLPDWMRTYSRVNLSALRVDVHAACSIKDINDQRVKLTNGLELNDYLLIWAAGVKAPVLAQELACEKDSQGRLVVDDKMCWGEKCFAIGDVASFRYQGKILRMAVQFSIAQSEAVAKSILRLIRGSRDMVSYKPLDLGFLLPFASRKACGMILRFRVKGLVGWFFHYLMCIYRSLSFKNKWGIFYDAFLR